MEKKKTFRERLAVLELSKTKVYRLAEDHRRVSRLAAGPTDQLRDAIIGHARAADDVSRTGNATVVGEMASYADSYPIAAPGEVEAWRERHLPARLRSLGRGWRCVPESAWEARISTMPPPAMYRAGLDRLTDGVLRAGIETDGWGPAISRTISPDHGAYEDAGILQVAERALGLALIDGVSLLHVVTRVDRTGGARQVVEVASISGLMDVDMVGTDTTGILLGMPTGPDDDDRAVAYYYDDEGGYVVQTIYEHSDQHGNGRAWRVVDQDVTSYRQIPVVPVYATQRRPWIGLPPYTAAAEIAIRWADAKSRQEASAAAAATMTVVVTGVGPGEEPQVGSASGLMTVGPDQGVTTVQSTGAPGLAHLDLVARSYAEQISMILPAAPDGAGYDGAEPATATQVRREVGATGVVLKRLATSVERALMAAYSRAAEAVGEQAGTIEILSDEAEQIMRGDDATEIAAEQPEVDGAELDDDGDRDED